MTAANSYITTFIHGYDVDSDTGNLTLFLQGGDYQKYKSLNLFLCNIQDDSGTVPLYIYSNEASAPVTNEIPLYIRCEPFALNSSIDLYLYNNGIYEDITLYIRGAGFRKGWYVSNDNITLFMNRPNEVSTIPIYLKTIEGQPNSYITLFIEGYEPATSWTTNSYCVLYIDGANIVEDNITLCMPNIHDVDNDNITLFVSGW